MKQLWGMIYKVKEFKGFAADSLDVLMRAKVVVSSNKIL